MTESSHRWYFWTHTGFPSKTIRDLKPLNTSRRQSHENVYDAYSLSLKLFNGLDLCCDVVGGRLEVLEDRVSLVDNGLVLENAPVVLEVNFSLLFLEVGEHATGLVVALAEGAEGGDRVPAKPEVDRQL